MATEAPASAVPRERRLLGELLLEAGLVSKRGLLEALAEQRRRGGRLGFHLMRLGRVTPAEFHLYIQEHFEALARASGAPIGDSPPVDLIPARVAHHYGMLPLEVESGLLTLALSAADTPRLIPAVEALTGLRVDPVIWPPAVIASALARFYPAEIGDGVWPRAAGDNLFSISDRHRGIRPLLPEALRVGAPAPEWLRAILSEATRQGTRRITLEPSAGGRHVSLWREGARRQSVELPPGCVAGVASLIETLARLASRGRVAPREGRFTALIEERRIRIAAAAFPGVAGDSFELHLRDDRVVQPERGTIAAEVPALAARLDRLAEEGRGLLVVAGAGRSDIEAGLQAVAALLDGRLRGVSLDAQAALGWEGAPAGGTDGAPLQARLDRALETLPDLIALPDIASPEVARVARAQAGERVVVACIEAADAFAAAERLARGTQFAGAEAASLVAGILGVRLMEPLCPSCRRPCDVGDLLTRGPRLAQPPSPEYAASSGCLACRGAAAPALLPVYEFLAPEAGERFFAPGHTAAALRADRHRRGMKTALVAGLEKAAAGLLDVREPLRLLLYEQC